jgi:two-component system response regulator FixJ
MASAPVIHLIDDDEALRDSLAFLLASSGVPVHSHASAAAFLKLFPALEASLVISDGRMPGMSGIELLEHLRRLRPGLPVILITGHGDVPLAVEAMRQGATNFIEKPFDDDAFLAAVDKALGEGAKAEQNHARRQALLERLERISTRERQVLEGLVTGKANKEIARDLRISPRTVEVYRANLMSKMQAASLSDLVRMALSAGVLEEGEPGRG